MPHTTARRTRTVMHPLHARLVRVERILDLTPRLRRVVLTGADLASGFPFPDFAPADHVKLVLPDEATGEIRLPTIVDDRLQRDELLATFRDYTVRHFDADARELSIDLVLHEHGPAGRWAIRAAVGDQIGVLGPRGSHVYPDGFARQILVADETAHPAVGRYLRDLDGRAVVIIGISETPDEFALFAERPGVTLRSLVVPVDGDRATVLADALASEDLDDEDTFIWVAGESRSLIPVRRLLRARGIDRDRWEVDGYWKRGAASYDHHADIED